MKVGLEIGAFRPLVPGIHADQRRAEKPPGLRMLDQPLQPGLVLGRRRAMHHQARALAPRIVVPAGHRGADQREPARRLAERHRHHLVVVIDLGGELVVETD